MIAWEQSKVQSIYLPPYFNSRLTENKVFLSEEINFLLNSYSRSVNMNTGLDTATF